MDDMNQTRYIRIHYCRISESKTVLLGVFLTLYFIIILGNFLLIGVFGADSGLHTPMYMTMCSLAVIDITRPTFTVFTMFIVFRSATYAIPLQACFTETYFFLALNSVECFILLIMDYDRYVAICHPLHYPTKISPGFTLKRIALCWLGGFLCPIPAFTLGMTKPYCGPSNVLQCFCDFSGVLRLACADIVLTVYVALAIGMYVLLIPIFFILLSYLKIVMAMLQISSPEGRIKVFSTCGFHLLVISVYFLTLTTVFMSYRIPETSVDMRIITSVFQNVFPPVMNPIIYCLRTKKIRASLVRTLKKKKILPSS